METNSFFDINRLKNLLIRQISVNYRTWLIATAAITGFLMFIGTVQLLFNTESIDANYMFGIFLPAFFIGGFIFTSMIFSELNSPHRGYLYLMLPASTFEKLVSAWLITSVLYVMFSCLVIYFINIYYVFIAEVFTSKTVEVVNLFSSDILRIFGVYLVLQSIFFLGAIYFRRINFFKTLLSGFILLVIFSMYSGILMKILFDTSSFHGEMVKDVSGIEFMLENVMQPLAEYLFWFAVAPFFLIVSYFRLKERQV